MGFHFASGRTHETDALICRYHYSGLVPPMTTVVGSMHLDGGLFGDLGECVGVCCFGEPAARWSQRVLELTRLVRKDGVDIPLSSLISKTVGIIKGRGICNLLVSLADWTQGHHGGIYQASSWHYNGQRGKRLDGLIIDGVFVSGRTCNHQYGTQSPTKLAAMHPNLSIEPHYDMGKHLYWKPINRKGKYKAKILNLKKIEYPKPLRGNL